MTSGNARVVGTRRVEVRGTRHRPHPSYCLRHRVRGRWNRIDPSCACAVRLPDATHARNELIDHRGLGRPRQADSIYTSTRCQRMSEDTYPEMFHVILSFGCFMFCVSLEYHLCSCTRNIILEDCIIHYYVC